MRISPPRRTRFIIFVFLPLISILPGFLHNFPRNLNEYNPLPKLFDRLSPNRVKELHIYLDNSSVIGRILEKLPFLEVVSLSYPGSSDLGSRGIGSGHALFKLKHLKDLRVSCQQLPFSDLESYALAAPLVTV